MKEERTDTEKIRNEISAQSSQTVPTTLTNFTWTPEFLPYLGGYVPLSSEDQAKFAMYLGKKGADVMAKSADRQEAYAYKLDILNRTEEKQQRKSLYKDDLVVNGNGQLYHVRIDPAGKLVGMSLICQQRNLALIEFTSYKGPTLYKIYMLRYDTEREADGIVFYEKDLTPSKVIKLLANAGVHIQMNSLTKANIPGLLLNLLKKCQLKKNIPFSNGWNIENGIWKWVEDTQLTYMGVASYAK